MAQFRVLGPVELDVGTPVDLGPAKQQTVLAALLMEVGAPVPVDALVDRVWGDAPPEQARATLYAYVARLRAALRGAAEISRRGGGYQVTVEPEQVDVHHARRLVDEARLAADPAERAAVLDEALALWRGVPLSGLSGPWVEAVRSRLVHERIDATAQWAEAGLALGRADAVIARTRPLAEEHPLVEPLTEVLIRALAAAGRGPEALTWFDRIRRLLRDELGADPGPRLRAAYAELLALTSGAPVSAVRAVPAQLPIDVRGFTGRGAELAELDRLVGPGRTSRVVVSAVAGTAGVGKTALAVHWAHRAADRFPDGQLYLDLRGYGPDPVVPPEEALAGFLRALGVPADDVPAGLQERAARYRTELAGRRMLVVLDNAGAAEQVRPLLPGTGDCAVLVTSRDSLAGLVSRDGAHRLGLDLLPLPEAVTLLRGLIGDRAADEPEAAERLAQLCARLPLALRVAAELAVSRPSSKLSALVDELQAGDAGAVLDRLDGGGDRHSAVRAVFSWSFRHLDDGAGDLFRLLGLHPGKDWDITAAAAMINGPVAAVRSSLEVLVRAHLVRPVGPDRFTMHDLLRSHAAGLAEAELDLAAREDVVGRICRHYADGARKAMAQSYPADHGPGPRPQADRPDAKGQQAQAEGLGWLDGERANLVAVCAFAARHGRLQEIVELAASIFRYLDVGGHFSEALQIHTAAAAAAHALGRPEDEAIAAKNVAGAYWRLGDYENAEREVTRALTLAGRTGNRLLEAMLLSNLGVLAQCRGRFRAALGHHERATGLFAEIAPLRQRRGLAEAGMCLMTLGQYEAAAEHLERSVGLTRQAGDRQFEACVLDSLAALLIRRGRLGEASAQLRLALALADELGARSDQASALTRMSLVALLQGEPEVALVTLERALDLAYSVGEPFHQAEVLIHRSEAHRLLDRPDAAAEDVRLGLELVRRIGHVPLFAAAHTRLGEALTELGQPEAALDEFRSALEIAAETEDRYEAARADLGLADAYAALGRRSEAEHVRALGRRIYAELGVPAPRRKLAPG